MNETDAMSKLVFSEHSIVIAGSCRKASPLRDPHDAQNGWAFLRSSTSHLSCPCCLGR